MANPTDPQNPSCPQDITLPKHIYRQPLKQQREPRVLLRPRQSHLPYPVIPAVNPRGASMKKGLELTTVQMTPCPLRSMVIQGSHRSTLRTGLTDPFRMSHPHICPLVLDIQTLLVPPSKAAQSPTSIDTVPYLSWLQASLEPF